MELYDLKSSLIDSVRSLSGKRPKAFVTILFFLAVFLLSSIPQSVILMIVFSTQYLADPAFIREVYALSFSPFALFEKLTSIFMDTPMLLLQLFLTVFGSAACIFYVVKIEKRPLQTMGFVRKNAFLHYLSGTLIGFLMIGAVVMIGKVIGVYEYGGVASDHSPFMILLFLFGFLLQGMEEEIFFRGFLMVSISRSKSTLFAVLVNSLIFAFMHLANPGISFLSLFDIFLFGVAVSLILLRTGSIWICGAVHSLWNFSQSNFFGLKTSGLSLYPSIFRFTETDVPSFFHGGSFGPEGGILSIAVMLITVVILLILPAGKKENDPEVIH